MICYLEMVFPTRDDIIGTGTLIGSDNTPRAVVTAGHNLYDPRYGGPALRVTITAGNASPLPFSPAGWTVNPRHIADPDAAAFDYAVITLPADHPFKRFGYMALNDYAGDLRGVPVCLSGYPEDQPAGTQWKAEGPIYYSTDRLIYHRLDTLGGQSGSPIFYAYGQDDTGNSLYSLLGIHGGYDGDLNRGVRTTPDVVNDLLQWSGMA